MKLEIRLPKLAPGYVLVGVYRILFEDGYFYIGSSSDLVSRASGWKSEHKRQRRSSDKEIGEKMRSKIMSDIGATFEIIELCSLEELRDREAVYLIANNESDFMLSDSRCYWKPVFQYKADGHFVKKHVSISAAARYNDCKISKIQRVLSGERKSYNGFVFNAEGYRQTKRASRWKQYKEIKEAS